MVLEALKLAGRGFAVFPVKPGTKEPYPDTRGYKDASNDPEVVRSLWAGREEASIGIACAQSSLLAIDVDFRNGGKEALPKLNDLPDTVTAKSGNGIHLYFRLPDLPEGRKWRSKLDGVSGVDVKVNGYVLAPPSLHPSGARYEWVSSPFDNSVAELPAHYIDRVTRQEQTDLAGIVSESGPAPLELLHYCRQQLAEHGPGSSDEWGAFQAACYLVFDMALSAEEALPILHDWDASWSQGARSTEWLIGRLTSAHRYAQGTKGFARAAWNFNQAVEARFARMGAIEGVESIVAEPGESDDFLALIRKAFSAIQSWRVGSGNQATKPEPIFEPAKKLFDAHYGTTPWLVDRILTDESVAFVAAEPKSIKTWCALELLCAVATNTPAFGQYKTGPRKPAVAFLAEDARKFTRNRLRALLASQEGREGGENWIHVACRQALDLKDDIQLARLIASCWVLPQKPGIVMIDPMRDVHPADEDKSTEMADVMARFRCIRDILQCTVLVVHHTGKMSADTAKRRRGQRMRGSGAIHGAVDCGFYLGIAESEDKQTSWRTDAEIELKGLQGAGLIGIRLDLTDNEQGEAVKAEWTIERVVAKTKEEDKDKSQKSDADRLRRCIGAIQGSVDGAASGRKITGAIGWGANRLRKVTGELIEQGIVERAFRGDQEAGYRLVESAYRQYQSEHLEAPQEKPEGG